MPSRASTLPLGLIFAFAATAQAQCQPENPLGGAFKNPPECNVVGTSDYENNVIWALNTVQTLSWTTTFTEDAFYNLTLWQENPSEFGAAVSNTPIYIHDVGQSTLESVRWVVQTYELDLARSPVFYLEMGWDGPRFFSHYFNITADSAGANDASSTSSPSSPSDSSPSSTGAPTSSATTPPASSAGGGGGLTQGARIGLGVGVGIGVPVVLLLGALAGMRMVQGRRAAAAAAVSSQSQYPELEEHAQQPLHGDFVAAGGPYETVANSSPFEVSTTAPGGHAQVGERHEI